MGVNVFYRGFCRTFQKVMWCAMWFLPWRTPEMLSGEGSLKSLPSFCQKKGFKKMLLVTDEMLLKLGLVQPLLDEMKNVGLDEKHLFEAFLLAE